MADKLYLVYHGKHPMGGIKADDSIRALEQARAIAPKGVKGKVRVRLAKYGSLPWSIANQGKYQG